MLKIDVNFNVMNQKRIYELMQNKSFDSILMSKNF